jgi:isopentenyl diphosphate isomerase/L-lactate dehydrogenase-like FMN-dependent dehydrogenase
MIVVLKMRHPWAQNASSLGAKCVILGRKMRHPWAQNASSLGAKCVILGRNFIKIFQ